MSLLSLIAFTPVLLALIYAGWQGYNFRNWSIAKQTTDPKDGNQLLSVALLVPYRNEADNLPDLLRDINELDYPYLDVYFIDDHSEDKGPELVRNAVATINQAAESASSLLQKTSPHLHALSLSDHLQGQQVQAHKKAAIAYAISRTTADLILTTDADCRLPATLIQDLTAAFDKGADVVLGPVLIAPPHRNLLSAFQALDFAAYQLYTAGCVAAGTPTLANGACFAFRRKLFLEVNGFAEVDHLPSGDDVLLLHKFHERPATKFAWHSGHPVLTKPVTSWRGLWWQRIRWAGKAGAYTSPALQRGQALAFLTALAIVGALLAGLVFHSGWFFTCLIAWAIKGLVDFLLLQDITKHYGHQRLLSWYLPVQLLYPFYLVAVGSGALLGLKAKWKGRMPVD